MDWSEVCDVLHKILVEPWPPQGSTRSNNLDENSWLDNYMSPDRLDGPILVGFIGGLGVRSSYEIDLQSVDIYSNLIDPNLDGDRHGLCERNCSNDSDIMFTKNVLRKLMENDLIRIQDAYSVLASVKLCLLQSHERVSLDVPC